MSELPKNFDFKSAETKWQKFWEEKKIYESFPNPDKPKFSVVIPPPNITGSLHYGHMLDITIPDIYCRRKRMQGYEVCWVPGMDHAGIATQMVVEKELAKDNKTKYDLGREKFIEFIWKWKEKNSGTISKQIRRLGASVDWSKERFTLDEGLSLNVRKVFVDLYKKGLIYRGNRIVNWDPGSKTAVSDDEIFYEERKDKLYFIKYFLEDSSEYISIATTRPETMFGDTAVAVNPDDERYKKYINKKVILPFLNKLIPVIGDKYVDLEFGTGALKITPAHDINDFEIGLRHNLDSITVLTKESTLNEYAGEFKGLDINVARKKILKRLKELDLLVKVEDLIHNVAISDRSQALIEPYLSEQWFVKMNELAGPAIEAVKSGEIRFYPSKYIKVYFNWMNNIRDWCISRQLWWGHQIPIWYHKQTGEIYCEVNPPEDIQNWKQDEDVLDTWFSSWLWPLSVFGWENNENDKSNPLLNYYYPTDLLSPGPDIIFLWVARMIMAGLEYTGKVPFKDVYLHSIIRDSTGIKMSKTLGNYSEPMDLMDKYGTDAMRFTMVYLAPLGSDVFFDEEKTQIGRNFVTKLWNAGRFLLMTKDKLAEGTEKYPEKDKDIVESWIESRFNSTLMNIDKYLNEYRINDYTKEIYNFVWSDFCDWYIELLKLRIKKEPHNSKQIINNAINHFENILMILHPVIPHVTEELWHNLSGDRNDKSISFEQLVKADGDMINEMVEENITNLKEIVTTIRNLRIKNSIHPHAKMKAYIVASKDSEILINNFKIYIMELCNLEVLEMIQKIGEGEFAHSVLSDIEIYLSMDSSLDSEKQTDMAKKEIVNLTNYLDVLNKKLANERFLQKASVEVIENERKKHFEAQTKLEKLIKQIS